MAPVTTSTDASAQRRSTDAGAAGVVERTAAHWFPPSLQVAALIAYPGGSYGRRSATVTASTMVQLLARGLRAAHRGGAPWSEAARRRFLADLARWWGPA
jgi:hypothetical protein